MSAAIAKDGGKKMKIKSIAAICKKSKVIYLYTKREEYSVMQYIGDGSTAYPLDGVPGTGCAEYHDHF